MKIAVTAMGHDLEARVSDRPGTASHLLVIELESGEFKSFAAPKGGGRGGGLQFTTMAIAEKCDAFLTHWCSPVTERQLVARGMKVVTGGKEASQPRFKNSNMNISSALPKQAMPRRGLSEK